MWTGPPKAELVISPEERAQLASMARSRSLSAALMLRARIGRASAVAPSRVASRSAASHWAYLFLPLARTKAKFGDLVLLVVSSLIMVGIFSNHAKAALREVKFALYSFGFDYCFVNTRNCSFASLRSG